MKRWRSNGFVSEMYEHVREILKHCISLKLDKENIFTSFQSFSTQENNQDTQTYSTYSTHKYIWMRHSTKRLDTKIKD